MMENVLKILAIIIGILVLLFRSFIFPRVESDEYFIEDGVIHGEYHSENCCSGASFTFKRPIYDIMVEKGQRICRQCFSPVDYEKICAINKINIIGLMFYMNQSGATQEEITQEMEQYELSHEVNNPED